MATPGLLSSGGDTLGPKCTVLIYGALDKHFSIPASFLPHNDLHIVLAASFGSYNGFYWLFLSNLMKTPPQFLVAEENEGIDSFIMTRVNHLDCCVGWDHYMYSIPTFT